MTEDQKPKPPTLGEIIDAAIDKEAVRVSTVDGSKWNDSIAKVRRDLRHTGQGRELMKLRRSPLADQPAADLAYSVRKTGEYAAAFATLEKWSR